MKRFRCEGCGATVEDPAPSGSTGVGVQCDYCGVVLCGQCAPTHHPEDARSCEASFKAAGPGFAYAFAVTASLGGFIV